jgi:hypothetical protein
LRGKVARCEEQDVVAAARKALALLTDNVDAPTLENVRAGVAAGGALIAGCDGRDNANTGFSHERGGHMRNHQTSTTTTTATSTDTAATQPCPPDPPVPDRYTINHYKIWKVQPVQLIKTVDLRGQFEGTAGDFTAATRQIEYIGNPVRKNDEIESIARPDWHLVIYGISAPPQPEREVVITNQLRIRETLRLGDAKWLMLPAAKPAADGAPQGGEPAGADHYLCYAVIGPTLAPITLVDDFDTWRQTTETTQRFGAAYFCVPVSKNGRQIYKEREHLTVYALTNPDPYAREVRTQDQFGPHTLHVRRSEYLAVPTTKLHWKEVGP